MWQVLKILYLILSWCRISCSFSALVCAMVWINGTRRVYRGLLNMETKSINFQSGAVSMSRRIPISLMVRATWNHSEWRWDSKQTSRIFKPVMQVTSCQSIQSRAKWSCELSKYQGVEVLILVHAYSINGLQSQKKHLLSGKRCQTEF